MVTKLAELDKLTSGTQHPQKHVAWRPPTNTGADTVKKCMVAHDYKVNNFYKKQ